MPSQQSLLCANSLPPLAFPILAAKADHPLIPLAAPSHEGPAFVMCDTGLVRLRGCMSVSKVKTRRGGSKLTRRKTQPPPPGCPPLRPHPLCGSSLCMYEGSDSVGQ